MNELQTLQRELSLTNSSVDIKNLKEICGKIGINGHIAVLTAHYLDKIIAGDKVVESRFTKNRVAPFQCINDKDVIFLKKTAGPIVAVSLVEKIKFFGPMGSGEAIKVMETYSEGLALEDMFKTSKSNSQYATLIWLKNVLTIKPIKLKKLDRRSWVVLSNGTDSWLF